jgi:TonB family protein
MSLPNVTTAPVDSGPNLLLDSHSPDTGARILRAGVGSLVAHVVIILLFAFIASLDIGGPKEAPEIATIHKTITHLVAPTPLTQKEPNRAKVAKEVKLENLLPRKEVAQHIPTPPVQPQKTFQAPPQPATPITPKPATVQPPEPPRIEASAKLPQVLPPSPIIQGPPPQIQTVEKPKLAFETPGGQNGSGSQKTGAVKIPVPKATVEEAVHSIARGGGQGGISVGDIDQPPSLGDALRQAPSPGKTASRLELLSDPMGVDFKPYLIRILAMVRRNWFAVIPESARLGRHGRVTLQFAIDRDGQVPKLVIAMPSGAEALDRAAVAGISASVPFPPLPKEFPGQQVRLQFAFEYK